MAFITSAALPRTGLSQSSAAALCVAPPAPLVAAPMHIRAAKHAQFKAAKKSNRCRPKKHRPSDIHRKPVPYDTEPLRAEGLPPVYTIEKASVSDEEE